MEHGHYPAQDVFQGSRARPRPRSGFSSKLPSGYPPSIKEEERSQQMNVNQCGLDTPESVLEEW